MLGVEWLKTLGSVLWNFLCLTMEFTFGGKLITLRGLSPSGLSLVEGSHVFRTSTASIKGFLLQIVSTWGCFFLGTGSSLGLIR